MYTKTVIWNNMWNILFRNYWISLTRMSHLWVQHNNFLFSPTNLYSHFHFHSSIPFLFTSPSTHPFHPSLFFVLTFSGSNPSAPLPFDFFLFALPLSLPLSFLSFLWRSPFASLLPSHSSLETFFICFHLCFSASNLSDYPPWYPSLFLLCFPMPRLLIPTFPSPLFHVTVDETSTWCFFYAK